jgi:hypothetical protein
MDTENILYIALIVAVILVAASIIKGIFFKKKTDLSKTHEKVRCACGWEGMISKYVDKCPKCGQVV